MVRHYIKGETLPASGWEGLELDPQWTWVALSSDGKAVGVLFGAPCHGVLFLLRIIITDDAPTATSLALLRAMLRDSRKAGLKGYLTFLDLRNEGEYKLARIASRAGAKIVPATGVWAGGTLQVNR